MKITRGMVEKAMGKGKLGAISINKVKKRMDNNLRRTM
jgi:hypothetical protein